MLRQLVLRACQSSLPILLDLGLGMAMGLCLLAVLIPLRLTLGSGADVPLAMLIAFCGTGGLHRLLRGVSLRSGVLCLTTGTLLAPIGLHLWSLGIQQFSVSTLAQPGAQFLAVLCGACCCLSLPGMGIAALLSHGSTATGSAEQGPFTNRKLTTWSLCLVGIALAFLLFPTTVLAWWGCRWMGIAGALLVTVCAWSRRHSTPSISVLRGEPHENGLLDWELAPFLTGASFVLVTHVGRQVVPSALYAEFATWGGLFLGLALTLLMQLWLRQNTRNLGVLLLATWGLITLLAYPWISGSALTISAWFSQTSLILGSRIVLLAMLTLPLGCGVALVNGAAFRNHVLRPATALLWFGCGFAFAIWLPVAPTLLAVILGFVGAVVALSGWGCSLADFTRQRLFKLIGLAGAPLVLAAVLSTSALYTPQQSERVLYSAQSFMSLRNGVERQLLPWLSEGRLLETKETVAGRFSLWKQRGVQLMLRHDGLYQDLVSLDTSLCPQPVSEVMPSLLPLVLKPEAEHVLVVGLHPSTLRTCAEFPLRSITTVDRQFSQPQSVSVVRKLLPVAEEFQHLAGDPELLLAGRHQRSYDIVICPTSQLLTAAGASLLTREFYDSVHRQLAPTGIFAQRLPYYDLGPEVVQHIAATMQDVFPQVMLTEPTAGELLFLASKRTDSLVTPGIVRSLQQPQVRRVLSHVGWDWAIPLSRGGLTSEYLAEFANGAAIHQVSGGQLALHLPIEVARWGRKSQTTREALAQHGRTIGALMGNVVEAHDVSDRLDDQQLARNVFTEHPDQFWAYRALLKSQLKDRPRVKIQQVSGELKRAMHPEDQRRKDYLVDLGEVATQPHPPLEQVLRLTRYTLSEEFDPLVNEFVHQEIALLCTRVEPRPIDLEIPHRLHAIYFAPPQDNSVSNLCEVTTLLADTLLDAAGDEEQATQQALQIDRRENWDQLNALLDVLTYRWQSRFAAGTGSKFDPIDTDRSINATELAIRALDKTASEVNLKYSEAGANDTVDWERRKLVLREQLLLPLKRHRSRQLGHR